jgi:hypothetical protein
MIYFGIALRAKKASKNWNEVCRCFNATLCSIYNQTDRDFKVIVVCHDMPELDGVYDEHVQFICVDIPVPENVGEMMKDKGNKVYICMHAIYNSLYIKKNVGTHVMIVDDDDLVSCHIAEFVNQAKDDRCYQSDYGYIYHKNERYIKKAMALYRTCGSCSIIYYRIDELPPVPFEERKKEKKYLFEESHRVLPVFCKKEGKRFGKTPFPTTVYLLGTGENHSIMCGVGLGWKRRLEQKLRFRIILKETIRREYNLVE